MSGLEADIVETSRDTLAVALKAVPALSSIPVTSVVELANDPDIKMYRFQDGQVLCQQGKRSFRALMVLNSGAVNIVRTLQNGSKLSSTSPPKILRRVEGQSSYFAEETLRKGTLYPYSAVAEGGPVEVIAVHHKTLAKYVNGRRLERLETMLVDLQMGTFRSIAELLSATAASSSDDDNVNTAESASPANSVMDSRRRKTMAMAELLDTDTRRCVDSSLLVVLLSRKMANPPQYYNAIRALRPDIDLMLQPLSVSEVGKHAQAIVQRHNDTNGGKMGTVSDVSESVVSFLHNKGDGNPLFTESLVLAMLEQGILQVHDGVCRMSKTADASTEGANSIALTIPTTMEDAIMSQVRSLSPEQQEVLKVASVAGVNFDLQLIMYLCAQEIRKLNPSEDQVLRKEMSVSMASTPMESEISTGSGKMTLTPGSTEVKTEEGQTKSTRGLNQTSSVKSKLMSRFMAGGVSSMITAQKNVSRVVTDLVRIHNILRYDVATSAYRFTRPIFRDTIYNTINIPLRRELHMKVGDLLLSSGRRENWTIGMHYANAGNTKMMQRKAAYFLSLSSDEALEHADYDRAISLLKTLLRCLSKNNVGIRHSVTFKTEVKAGVGEFQQTKQGDARLGGMESAVLPTLFGKSEFGSRENLSAITLRSYTMRRLADAFWQKSDFENARFYLAAAVNVHAPQEESSRVTAAAVAREDLSRKGGRKKRAHASRMSLWLKPNTSGDAASLPGKKMRKKKKQDRDGREESSASMHTANKALTVQREGSRAGFAAAMKASVASPQWAKIRGAVGTMAGTGIIQDKYSQEFVDSTVHRYRMERRELTKSALLAAHLACVSGWAVLGIHDLKKEATFFEDVLKMANIGEVSFLQTGLLHVICELIRAARPKITLLEKGCHCCSVVKGMGFARKGSDDEDTAGDPFEALLDRLSQRFDDVDQAMTRKGETKEEEEYAVQEEKDRDEVSHHRAAALFSFVSSLWYLSKGRWEEAEERATQASEEYEMLNRVKMYIQSQRLVILSHALTGNLKLAHRAARRITLTMSSTKNIRIQLLLLCDQLWTNFASGSWKKPAKLWHAVNECHRLSKAVEVYEFGSLSPEEVVWIYGTLSNVVLHGCNNMVEAIRFANTALVHSRNLQDIARMLDMGEKEEKEEEEEEEKETMRRKMNKGNEGLCPSSSYSTTLNGRASFRPQAASAPPMTTMGRKPQPWSWSKLHTASATPVSAALLFALLGSEAMFDVFITAFDQACSADSFDAVAVSWHRAACQDVLRMQKHIARTVDIGRCFVAYTELRIMRSISKPQTLESKENVAKVAHAQGLAEEHHCSLLHTSIQFEKALFEFISAEEKMSRSTLGNKELELRRDQRKSTSEHLKTVIAQFGLMGHVAKECCAKRTVKQFVEMSKDGRLCRRLQMTGEWLE